MKCEIIRLLRTPSSERYLLRKEDTDQGALDLHYLADGRVAGTLTIFEDAKISDEQVHDLLVYLDDVLLPDVSLEQDNFIVTVVRGRALGSFEYSVDH